MIQLQSLHQGLRRSRAARRGHVAGRRSRSRRPVRSQRRRQDDAPADAGRIRRAGQRADSPPQRAHDRLSAAGRPVAQRPVRRRRSQPRAQAAARHEGRDARSRASARRRHGADRRARRAAPPLQRSAGTLSHRRRLSARAEGRDRPARPRLRAAGFRQAHRSPVRRLADAAGAGEAAARAARSAAARRADQPPRSRGAQLARVVSRRLSALGHPRVARSLLSRRRGHAHRRPVAAHDHRLPLQLFAVSRTARRAHARGCARRRSGRTRRSRASRSSSIASATRRPRRRRCRAA